MNRNNPEQGRLTSNYDRRQGNWLTRRRALLCVAATLFALAVPAWAQRAVPPRTPKAGSIRTMTANAYIGADLAPAFSINPNDPAGAIAITTPIYLQVLASDPPARMAGLAEEIAKRKPHVVGLEEIWMLEKAPLPTGDYAVVYDFLELLLARLEAEGAHYKVVSSSTEARIALPVMDVSDQPVLTRITDREVILVRDEMTVSNPQQGEFQNILVVPNVFVLKRGWCSVDVKTDETAFRFICSHLDDESLPTFQLAQAAELLEVVQASTLPVILVGDFNADPLNRNGTQATYNLLTHDLKDAWTTVFPQRRSAGLTWGHDAELADPSDKLEWRIDLVLFKGGGLEPTGVQVLDMRLHRGTAPLWASDHAAVAAQFEIVRPSSFARGRAPHR